MIHKICAKSNSTAPFSCGVFACIIIYLPAFVISDIWPLSSAIPNCKAISTALHFAYSLSQSICKCYRTQACSDVRIKLTLTILHTQTLTNALASSSHLLAHPPLFIKSFIICTIFLFALLFSNLQLDLALYVGLTMALISSIKYALLCSLHFGLLMKSLA